MEKPHALAESGALGHPLEDKGRPEIASQDTLQRVEETRQEALDIVDPERVLREFISKQFTSGDLAADRGWRPRFQAWIAERLQGGYPSAGSYFGNLKKSGYAFGSEKEQIMTAMVLYELQHLEQEPPNMQRKIIELAWELSKDDSRLGTTLARYLHTLPLERLTDIRFVERGCLPDLAVQRISGSETQEAVAILDRVTPEILGSPPDPEKAIDSFDSYANYPVRVRTTVILRAIERDAAFASALWRALESALQRGGKIPEGYAFEQQVRQCQTDEERRQLYRKKHLLTGARALLASHPSLRAGLEAWQSNAAERLRADEEQRRALQRQRAREETNRHLRMAIAQLSDLKLPSVPFMPHETADASVCSVSNWKVITLKGPAPFFDGRNTGSYSYLQAKISVYAESDTDPALREQLKQTWEAIQEPLLQQLTTLHAQAKAQYEEFKRNRHNVEIRAYLQSLNQAQVNTDVLVTRLSRNPFVNQRELEELETISWLSQFQTEASPLVYFDREIERRLRQYHLAGSADIEAVRQGWKVRRAELKVALGNMAIAKLQEIAAGILGRADDNMLERLRSPSPETALPPDFLIKLADQIESLLQQRRQQVEHERAESRRETILDTQRGYLLDQISKETDYLLDLYSIGSGLPLPSAQGRAVEGDSGVVGSVTMGMGQSLRMEQRLELSQRLDIHVVDEITLEMGEGLEEIRRRRKIVNWVAPHEIAHLADWCSGHVTRQAIERNAEQIQEVVRTVEQRGGESINARTLAGMLKECTIDGIGLRLLQTYGTTDPFEAEEGDRHSAVTGAFLTATGVAREIVERESEEGDVTAWTLFLIRLQEVASILSKLPRVSEIRRRQFKEELQALAELERKLTDQWQQDHSSPFLMPKERQAIGKLCKQFFTQEACQILLPPVGPVDV